MHERCDSHHRYRLDAASRQVIEPSRELLKNEKKFANTRFNAINASRRVICPIHDDIDASQIPVKSPDLTSREMILPKIAAGESHAMSACITKYGTMVWSITKNYIHDVTEAEDLVQEIFTEVWKKAGTFNPAMAAESTFIGLIARRRSVDFLRRKNRRPEFEQLEVAKSLIQPMTDESSVSCDPDAVQSSLASLPSETRHLFQLFFENGLTHPEIAEKTGLPLGTVKTRLRRGLISIREHLQAIGNPNSHSAS